MGKRVLVIAAHPDDELLGCGGTVAKHATEGDEVRTIIMCEGESLRYKGMNVNQSVAIEEANKILGVKHVYHLKFPDQKLDTFSLVDIITPIEDIIEEYQPQIVYCQFGGDINRDHQILSEAAMVALRPIVGFIEEFYQFYTVGSTEWAYPKTYHPDTWVDIKDYLDTKLKAFSCYTSEIREWPHPRSLKSLEYLAYYTGSTCCLEAAESFVTIRRVKR